MRTFWNVLRFLPFFLLFTVVYFGVGLLTFGELLWKHGLHTERWRH